MSTPAIHPQSVSSTTGAFEDDRYPLESLLKRYLPERTIKQILKDPKLVNFLTEARKEFDSQGIRSITVKKQHGTITIIVTLEKEVEQCIAIPAQDGYVESRSCATTRVITSQRSLVMDKRFISRFLPKPKPRSTLKNNVAHVDNAAAPKPPPPVAPSLPADPDRMVALERARTIERRENPSWIVIDVKTEGHMALIENVQTSQRRWVVRDDLFEETRSQKSQWNIMTAEEMMRTNTVPALKVPYPTRFHEFYARFFPAPSCDRGECHGDPDDPFSIPCPLVNFNVKFADGDKAELQWFRNAIAVIKLFPDRLPFIARNFTQKEKTLFNALRAKDNLSSLERMLATRHKEWFKPL